MIKKSILKTLTYFDLRDFPLTREEISKYLLRVAPEQEATTEIDEALASLEREGAIVRMGDYFHLPGREANLLQREKSRELVKQRLGKVRKIIRYARFIPYIRGIILTGSMAAGYSNEQSDIDLLVITKPGRIFMARQLLTGLANYIFRNRRHGDKVAGRVCLNHYVIDGVSPHVFYPFYVCLEYANMSVLLNHGFADFLSQESWLKEHLLNPPQKIRISEQLIKPAKRVQKVVETIAEILGAGLWEQILGKYQKSRIIFSPGILFTDQEISFHPGGKWETIKTVFEAKLRP